MEALCQELCHCGQSNNVRICVFNKTKKNHRCNLRNLVNFFIIDDELIEPRASPFLYFYCQIIFFNFFKFKNNCKFGSVTKPHYVTFSLHGIRDEEGTRLYASFPRFVLVIVRSHANEQID